MAMTSFWPDWTFHLFCIRKSEALTENQGFVNDTVPLAHHDSHNAAKAQKKCGDF